MSNALARTKLAFKLSEVIQGLEEDKVAFKVFQQEISVFETSDPDLTRLIDLIKNKVFVTSRDNRGNRWKDALTAFLSEQPSEACKDFVQELGNLLD